MFLEQKYILKEDLKILTVIITKKALKKPRPGRNICNSPCKHHSNQVLTVRARHTVNDNLKFSFHTQFPNQHNDNYYNAVFRKATVTPGL